MFSLFFFHKNIKINDYFRSHCFYITFDFMSFNDNLKTQQEIFGETIVTTKTKKYVNEYN